jgi:hypothetical protein
MEYDFTVNEHFSVERRQVGNERHPVLVIDDLLRDPESMVRYAASVSQFKPSPLAYPGIIAPAPDAYVDSMVNAVVPLISATFGVQADSAHLLECFFAIATFPAEKLHFGQRLPHVDSFEPGQIAGVHYLCGSAHSGTALYRHRATGYETLTEQKHRQVQAHMVRDVANQQLPAEYPNAANHFYEQTARFDVRFNRLILYRGTMLHSMMVEPGATLVPNPRVGRLTTNTFLRFDNAST